MESSGMRHLSNSINAKGITMIVRYKLLQTSEKFFVKRSWHHCRKIHTEPLHHEDSFWIKHRHTCVIFLQRKVGIFYSN